LLEQLGIYIYSIKLKKKKKKKKKKKININSYYLIDRFENITRGIKTFSVLNIYELSNGENEAVLRWGTIPDTSINGGLLR